MSVQCCLNTLNLQKRKYGAQACDSFGTAEAALFTDKSHYFQVERQKAWHPQQGTATWFCCVCRALFPPLPPPLEICIMSNKFSNWIIKERKIRQLYFCRWFAPEGSQTCINNVTTFNFDTKELGGKKRDKTCFFSSSCKGICCLAQRSTEAQFFVLFGLQEIVCWGRKEGRGCSDSKVMRVSFVAHDAAVSLAVFLN